MTKLEDLMLQIVLALGLLGSLWFCAAHYGDRQFKAGYAAAIAAGKEARDSEAVAALAIESGLRTKLGAQDADALKKDQEYAKSLETAQRRVRSGTDRLLCPTSAIPAATPPGDRPAASEPPTDGEGPAIVPEVAAEILGDGAAVASLVSRYDQVVERFADCRAVNAK